jgi:hypothetical protein
MTKLEALAAARKIAFDGKMIMIVYLDGEWGIAEYSADWLKHMHEKNVFYVLPRGEVTQLV